jgi:hypothetical protein
MNWDANITLPLQSIGRNPSIVTQAVVLAYTGWGYNFYSVTNQLRADDLLIRGKISALLSRTAADISKLGAKLAASIPPPTRQMPLPGQEIMPIVVDLRRLAGEIDGLAAKMTALSTPSRDKIWDRHRSEKDLLIRLQGFDLYLGQLAFDLQKLVDGKTPAEMKDEQLRAQIEAKLQDMKNFLREREDALGL